MSREQFEAALQRHAEEAGHDEPSLARDGDGYADPATQAAWWGWREGRNAGLEEAAIVAESDIAPTASESALAARENAGCQIRALKGAAQSKL